MLKSAINKKFKALLFSSVIVTTLATPFLSFAAGGADAILGEWTTGEGKSKVKIYKEGDIYSGKISWLKEPLKDGKPKVDDKNPDEAKRSQPLMGLVLIKNFKFVSEGKWENGTIYDPRNGKEYSCIINMKDPKTLDVRGYIGISLIGRSDTWKR